jgi:cation transporter-like permease
MDKSNDMDRKLTYSVTMMVASTLCLSVLGMVAAFLLGLWAKEVDNAEIFSMLHPAFQTIIGGFIGLLAGVKLGQGNKAHSCKHCGE